MSNIKACDFCGYELLTKFDDSAYAIIIKKRINFYDGIFFWASKRKLDVCEDCMKDIRYGLKNKELRSGQKVEL